MTVSLSKRPTYSVKKWSRERVAQSFRWTGFNRLARKFRTGAVVLYYHGVEPEITDSQVQEIHLPLELFERHIDYLRKNFDIISLPYLLDCLKNGYRLDPLSVLITFDDGYKNNRSIVWPFLSSLEIPFSIFISTRHIDEGLRFPTYFLRAALFCSEHRDIHIKSMNLSFDISTQEKKIAAKVYLERLLKQSSQAVVNRIISDVRASIRAERWAEINGRFHSDEPLSWEDVRQLAENGVAIGSHCHDHFILHSKQALSEMDYQISTSKQMIEEKLGQCPYFAYPEGGSSNLDGNAILSVANSRYEMGFTSVGGEINEKLNPFILPRVGIPSRFDNFVFNLNTGYRFNRTFEKWSRQYLGFPP